MAGSLSHRVIPFPSPLSTTANSEAVKRLITAARAAERAITLAIGCDVARKNQIVVQLRAAIAEVKKAGMQR